jgi:hypothetical protein
VEHSTTTIPFRWDSDLSSSVTSVPTEPDVQQLGPSQQDENRRVSRFQRLASEGGIVYLLSLAIFLTIAVLLDFTYKTYPGDAVSRMANGFYIVYSRDPHLAAFGFVWTPLVSLVDLVFLLGDHVWPALAHNDMAGSLTSALAMAGATHQLRAALREWGVGRTSRLLLTTFFVVNPMILFYGGNGMSEALFLFTLTASTRYLLRWIHAEDLRSLAYAATALGFSYLTRNEAAAAIVAGGVVVALVSYWRSKGKRSIRVRTAFADSTVFILPGVVAAVGWAIATYVITGYFFGQLSSVYGNSQQQKLIVHFAFSGRVVFVLEAIVSMWPTILIVMLVAVIIALRRRDPRILAPLAILGGALGFDTAAYMTNGLANYYRFFIATLPIEILVIGSVIAALGSARSHRTDDIPSVPVSPSKSKARRVAAIAVVLVTMIPCTLTTAFAMFNPKFDVQETQWLGFIFAAHPNKGELLWQQRHPTIVRISSYFGDLGLPNGDVIVDNSTDCVPEMIVSIRQPKIFVIPNDRDFQKELADPLTFHAHYILEPNPIQIPVSAQNNEYPTLWTKGAGFTEQVHQFPASGTCPEFRLFKVIGHPSAIQ